MRIWSKFIVDEMLKVFPFGNIHPGQKVEKCHFGQKIFMADTLQVSSTVEMCVCVGGGGGCNACRTQGDVLLWVCHCLLFCVCAMFDTTLSLVKAVGGAIQHVK